MKEYTMTKTLFKMKKKTHTTVRVKRRRELYEGNFGTVSFGDGPNDFCKRPWTLNKVMATFLFCLLWSECPLSSLSSLIQCFVLFFFSFDEATCLISTSWHRNL